MSHTPGPWAYSDRPPYGEEDGACGLFVHTPNPVMTIAVCDASTKLSSEQMRANARLIAAAPDFADIARRAQSLANSRSGDYGTLTHDELCEFMVELDEVLSKTEEQS